MADAASVDWLVVSMVSDDVSFGPFTEEEAKRFAGRNENYQAFTVEALRRDIYSAVKWGLA